MADLVLDKAVRHPTSNAQPGLLIEAQFLFPFFVCHPAYFIVQVMPRCLFVKGMVALLLGISGRNSRNLLFHCTFVNLEGFLFML